MMKKMGITDLNKIYRVDELAKGDDLLFVATGVTTGDVLLGVKSTEKYIETESIVFSSKERTIRTIKTKHLL